MDSQQNDSNEGLRVRLTHEQYRHFLDGAVYTDHRYPWLRQHQYFIDIATVDDEGAWLKLG